MWIRIIAHVINNNIPYSNKSISMSEIWIRRQLWIYRILKHVNGIGCVPSQYNVGNVLTWLNLSCTKKRIGLSDQNHFACRRCPLIASLQSRRATKISFITPAWGNSVVLTKGAIQQSPIDSSVLSSNRSTQNRFNTSLWNTMNGEKLKLWGKLLNVTQEWMKGSSFMQL